MTDNSPSPNNLIISQHHLKDVFRQVGKPVMMRCELVGTGLEWLGFGASRGEALIDLTRNVRKYLEKYPT